MNYKRIFLYVLVISLSVSVWLSSGCDKLINMIVETPENTDTNNNLEAISAQLSEEQIKEIENSLTIKKGEFQETTLSRDPFSPKGRQAGGDEEVVIEKPTRPVRPVTPTVDPTHNLKLTAIFAGSGFELATINGKTCSVGSEVSGFRVTAIKPNHVVVNKAGKNHTLKLSK